MRDPLRKCLSMGLSLGLFLSLSIFLSLPVYAQTEIQTEIPIPAPIPEPVLEPALEPVLIPTPEATGMQVHVPTNPWIVDQTYHPLLSAVAINGIALGATLGLTVGWYIWPVPAPSGIDDFFTPLFAITRNGLMGALIGGGLSIASVLPLQGYIEHPDGDPNGPPLDPLRAAQIGNGIFWGTWYGLETALVVASSQSIPITSPNAEAAWALVQAVSLVPAALGGVTGGVVANWLPMPKNASQLGMRSIWGMAGMISVAQLGIPTFCDRAACSTPTTTLAVMAGQTAGLFLGDTIGQSGNYTDQEVLLIGALGVAGYFAGGIFAGFTGLGYTLGHTTIANVGMLATLTGSSILMYGE